MEESRPRERQQQNNNPVALTSCIKEMEPEVLEITLSLLESYPPPPMIIVAPPITPIRLPSPPSDFEDECESLKLKKKGKGKKGGPVMSQRQNEENRILNVMPGPVSALVGAHLFNNNWE